MNLSQHTFIGTTRNFSDEMFAFCIFFPSVNVPEFLNLFSEQIDTHREMTTHCLMAIFHQKIEKKKNFIILF